MVEKLRSSDQNSIGNDLAGRDSRILPSLNLYKSLWKTRTKDPEIRTRSLVTLDLDLVLINEGFCNKLRDQEEQRFTDWENWKKFTKTEDMSDKLGKKPTESEDMYESVELGHLLTRVAGAREMDEIGMCVDCSFVNNAGLRDSGENWVWAAPTQQLKVTMFLKEHRILEAFFEISGDSSLGDVGGKGDGKVGERKTGKGAELLQWEIVQFGFLGNTGLDCEMSSSKSLTESFRKFENRNPKLSSKLNYVKLAYDDDLDVLSWVKAHKIMKRFKNPILYRNVRFPLKFSELVHTDYIEQSLGSQTNIVPTENSNAVMEVYGGAPQS
ncbi:hypothetical protein PPACK8108_LOCUS1905 [Phakopsora pachyrhizi]|uniref:Uncharacterized protein n=1 Tax=Phakopsora pachyrhizi TaxID=170000 RepID=A0AAV0AHV6_PHAPC|nr:hypothetical protein PPACK8108_LOCUS1905 [Phakopsora pachyrhizi]